MVCTSTAPIDLIVIVGTAKLLHVYVPLNQRLGMEPPPCATSSRYEVPPPVFAAPVLLVAPLQALVWMAKMVFRGYIGAMAVCITAAPRLTPLPSTRLCSRPSIHLLSLAGLILQTERGSP